MHAKNVIAVSALLLTVSALHHGLHAQDDLKTKWKNKGFEPELSVTQFYQGIVSGGVDSNSEYNGVAHALLKFDLGKLLGLSYWLAEIKGDMRFGGPLLSGTGGVNPVNTAVITPAADGTEIAITALNLTRLFPIDLKKGRLIAFSLGRYNTIDLLIEDFFAGAGTERFMNLAHIGPLTVLREVPLVTNGFSVNYLDGGEPLYTLAIMDPNDHTLDSGLSELFADGVTFYPMVSFPTKWFGKSGKQTLSGAITTKEYTPFDAIRQIIIPGPPLNPVEPEAGSWSASLVVRQYIVERGSKDGWGLFSQLSFSNQSTSPITTFFDIGLGGNGLFSSRRHDEFGIAYAYSDLSSELKDNLDLPIIGVRLQPEHQVEAFYNLHIARWLQLTGDFQVVRGVRPDVDTSIIPGVRLRILF